jgi:hypothetical protein
MEVSPHTTPNRLVAANSEKHQRLVESHHYQLDFKKFQLRNPAADYIIYHDDEEDG